MSKQIKITLCTHHNEECVNECWGKWWDVTGDGGNYRFITKPRYGCDLVSREDFGDGRRKDFEVRDKPDLFPSEEAVSFTGKASYITIGRSDVLWEKEVKKMLSVYHVIAWHKDKMGNRVALAYRNWLVAKCPDNARVKAVLDEANWTGKNNTNPDDFIWQVVPVL